MVLLASVLLLGASVLSVSSQTTTAPPASTPTLGSSPLPLTQYSFQYPNLPEQVNPFNVGRGPQSGYNICNSTTEGPQSQCQTMFLNSITDFCLWGSPTANGVIGDVEAVVVAYCTKSGHGTRLIPPGTLTAVQFIKTPGYIQVTGLFNQTGIGLKPSDSGGELDPHGADLAGNPLGGLLFSNNLPSANNTITQVKNWSNFVGSNQFCFKACDNKITSPDFCQNVFDTQGCSFNMPASYKPDEFSVCLGDNQNEPGGNPVIPATSSCTTYSSAELYPNTATSASATSAGSTSSRSSSSTPTSTGGSSSKGSSAAAPAIARSGSGLFALAASIAVGAMVGVVVVL